MKFKEDIVASVKEDFKRRQEQRRSLELNWRLDMNFLIGNQYCFLRILKIYISFNYAHIEKKAT